METPYQEVQRHFVLPFPLYPFQVEAVDDLAPLTNSGVYFEPGLGKTATATVCALHHLLHGSDQVVVTMPPIIIPNWARWLRSIRRADGRPLRVTEYRGTPAKRAAMSLDGDFILMSMDIFKRDNKRLCDDLSSRRIHVILDEAQCIKDVSTGNHKIYRSFVETQSHQLLTGTPLNAPLDGYAYIRLVAPGTYQNLAQFERIHVKARDFFDKPTEYQNLDLLQTNMQINAVRKTKEDVLPDLPECIVTHLEYDLDSRHLKLYRQLASEQLLKLPDGGKIDATQASALYHALGQIIMQWHYFGQDEALKSAGYDLIDEVLDELGDKKLIVFANYQRTNAEIQRRFRCPGLWGQVSAGAKQLALDTFINEPTCRLITMNPRAGGVGVDGMQHVCADVLYVEPPITPTHWVQSLSRAHRTGQTKAVTVRMGQAAGTIQKHLISTLTAKEAVVNPLQGSRAMLQEALFGET